MKIRYLSVVLLTLSVITVGANIRLLAEDLPQSAGLILEPIPSPTADSIWAGLAAARPRYLTISFKSKDGKSGQVSINQEDGTIKYSGAYAPDQAARIFWEAMGKSAQCIP